MTESQWLKGRKPQPMLAFLRRNASDRKLRLFACAICRRVWDRLEHRSSRAVVEVAELFADGETTKSALMAAGIGANRGASTYAADGARCCGYVSTFAAASRASSFIAFTAFRAGPQCDVLREVFGNPFRPVVFDPAWRSADVVA